MKISVIGTGYVGFVTGACLAQRGHEVICVDIRSDLVDCLNSGRTPIHEPGLQEIVEFATTSHRLTATTDTRRAVLETEVTLICVGTPNSASGVDLSQITTAAENIGAALSDKENYHVVAVKSTVLPGTTEGVVKTSIECHSGRNLGDGWGLCMNPEFLREGRAVADFLSPDRIVVGAADEKAASVILRLYEEFQCPKLVTTPRTAEMIKYVSNSLLATMISFSNEIGNLCGAVPGIDARQVWKGVHLDRRLTPIAEQIARPAGVTEYLWHGLGFGGSCFPKDVAALRGFGRRFAENTRMLDAVLQINAEQPLRLVSLLEQETDLMGRKVAVLGLAFKPGTNDLRESPALPVITALSQRGALLVAHDPVAMPDARRRPEFVGVTFAKDWADALRDADACCVVTAWPEYRGIQPWDFRKLMRRPLVIDGRGIFEPGPLAAAGVIWRGIGYRHDVGVRPFECLREYSAT
jgi:UDPglucose 6-dehydrogenase